jgi:hypothetical protein
MIENNNSFDVIIIIILSLFVAFIIGFSIIYIVDSKLSSVTINVPKANCNIPPIYLKMDNDSEMREIKLDDNISKEENIEEFGNLPDYPENNPEKDKNLIGGLIGNNLGNDIIEREAKIYKEKNPNFNTVNKLPYIVNTDTGKINHKIELVENKDSPLMRLERDNLKYINETISNCKSKESEVDLKVNDTFKGYNSYVDLGKDSFANIRSIGKSMLTGYVDYPVPS